MDNVSACAQLSLQFDHCNIQRASPITAVLRTKDQLSDHNNDPTSCLWLWWWWSSNPRGEQQKARLTDTDQRLSSVIVLSVWSPQRFCWFFCAVRLHHILIEALIKNITTILYSSPCSHTFLCGTVPKNITTSTAVWNPGGPALKADQHPSRALKDTSQGSVIEEE